MPGSQLISHCLVSSLFTPKVRILRKERVYVLGRDRKNPFPLPSEIVSRKHAEIKWQDEDERFHIYDLGSKNGTKINNELIVDHPLQNGDSLWIGPFHLKYREYEGDIAGLLDEASTENDATVSLSRNVLQRPAEGIVFGGHFTGSELLEICQLISFNEKDGVLHITTPAGRGSLAFRRGAVVRARYGVGGAKGELKGREAAESLLDASTGRFEFLSSDKGKEEMCMATEHLIMDAARRRDELGETQDAAPLDGGDLDLEPLDQPPPM